MINLLNVFSLNAGNTLQQDGQPFNVKDFILRKMLQLSLQVSINSSANGLRYTALKISELQIAKVFECQKEVILIYCITS